MAFDQTGQPTYGRLATDRPVQFKANGYYTLPWGTNVGAVFYAMSGTPITRTVNMVSSLPVMYLGRGSDSRMPMFSQTDLQLQQSFNIGGTRRIEVSVNVLNLFDQDTALSRFAAMTRENVAIFDPDFFAGFNMDAVLAGQPGVRIDPRFLQDNIFQGARAIRLGAKFSF